MEWLRSRNLVLSKLSNIRTKIKLGRLVEEGAYCLHIHMSVSVNITQLVKRLLPNT